MYCRLYIHCSSAKQVTALLEKEFGEYTKKMSRYCFEDFDVIFDMNEEANYNKMRTYPDGFLYYEIKAELEIYNDHIKLTDRILKLLWDDRITAVASCDYEEGLNAIFSAYRSRDGFTNRKRKIKEKQNEDKTIYIRCGF